MKYRTKNFKKRVSREEAKRRRYEYKRNNNIRELIIIIIQYNIIIGMKRIEIGCGIVWLIFIQNNLFIILIRLFV